MNEKYWLDKRKKEKKAKRKKKMGIIAGVIIGILAIPLIINLGNQMLINSKHHAWLNDYEVLTRFEEPVVIIDVYSWDNGYWMDINDVMIWMSDWDYKFQTNSKYEHSQIFSEYQVDEGQQVILLWERRNYINQDNGTLKHVLINWT
jgi:hypothetical protein